MIQKTAANTQLNQKIGSEPLRIASEIPIPVALAKTAILPSGGSTVIDRLRQRRIDNCQLNPKNLEASKIQSVATRIASWVSNTKLVVWTSVNLLKHTRFWMLMGAPTEKSRSQVDKAVDEISGSMHLSKAIHALSPSIAEWVQEKLIALKLHESVSQFLQDEHWTVQTFVDVLFPTLYVNLAKSLKENDNLPVNDKISLVDITAYICKIINAHLPDIEARIQEVDKISDPVSKEAEMCALFIPLTEDFLAIALPNGVKDLPLTQIPMLSNYFWDSIQKQILPSLFLDVYRQLVLSSKTTLKEELIQRPGGQSLVSMAQTGGKQAAETLAEVCTGVKTLDKNNQLSDLAVAISKNLDSMIYGSDQFKTWLMGWLLSLISDFGTSDKPEIKQLWKFFGGYFEPLLMHVFAHLSKVPEIPPSHTGRQPDVFGIMAIRFFTMTSQFFNANKTIIKERMDVLKSLPEANPDEDPVLLGIFKSYADNLLSMMGLDHPETLPLPEFIRGVLVGQLKETAPPFLLRQYFAFTDSPIENDATRRRLRELFFDPKNLEDPSIAVKIIAALHAEGNSAGATLFDKFYQDLWQESGTERIAKTLEAMCSVIADDIVSATSRYLGLSAQIQLKESDNDFMREMAVYLHRLIETWLLETLVHVTETEQAGLPHADGKHPQFLLAAKVMVQLAGIFTHGLKGVEQRLKEAQGNDEAITQSFSAFATGLHAFLGTNPFKHLPLGHLPNAEILKEALWGSVKEVALPDQAYKEYSHTTVWQNMLDKSYEELERCYHTTHPLWACRVLAQYATDYIRHFLTSSSDEAAKLMLDSMTHYFKRTDVRATTNTDAEFDQAAPLLSENVSAIASSSEPQFDDIWEALTHYNEAMIAKVFAELSKTIHEIELFNPDLMVDLALQMIKDTTEHFSAVSRAAEDAGEEHAYRLKISDMLTAFGTSLHDGVPIDPLASEEEKNKTRLQGFFIPLTAKMLELANLSSKDFPIPSMLKENIGEIAVNDVIPMAMMSAYQRMLEPQVRDALMLNFIQTLYTALKVEGGLPKQEKIEEAPHQPDTKQKCLYETCGQLALELVKLIPDTAVQYVFMKEKVKNMSAEAIGDAMMPYLSRWTLLQMIDSMLYNGLLSLHPAKWEGKLGRETLVPRKAFVRPDGKMELKPVKKFKFDFASSPAEHDAQQALEKEEADKIRTQLRGGFTKTISQQIHANAWAFIKSLWSSMQQHFNDFIEERYPDKGVDIKAYADKIFHKVFFDLLGPVIHFLTAPLIAAVKYIIERLAIDKRSQDIIENVHATILENLFYKGTFTIFDTLLRLHPKERSNAESSSA